MVEHIIVKQEVIIEGNSACQHRAVEYIYNGIDSQHWWCDERGCGRQEKLTFTSPKIVFPPKAYIRITSRGSGDEYVAQADEQGVLQEYLLQNQRFKVADLESKL